MNKAEHIAIAWYEGNYTETDARLSSEIQGVSFDSVKEIYGQLYHKYEALSR